jgi:diguanylate cyclase (GGDEF)-like protein
MQRIRMSSVTPFPAQYKKIIARLQQDYLAYVKHHLADFHRMEGLMKQNALSQRDFQDLYRLSHDFAGSGATFGFPEISQAGRDLHLTMKASLDSHAGEESPQSPLLVEKMGTFKMALVLALGREMQEQGDGVALPGMPDPVVSNESSDIYILAKSDEQVPALAEQVRHFGYNAIVNAAPDAIRAAIGRSELKGLVAFSDMTEKETAWLRSIWGTAPGGGAIAIPFIIVAPDGDFGTRLAAARLGAQGFFTGQADALKLIEMIEQISLKFAAPARYNVMIVDDDQMLSEFYSHALRQAGMTVTTVSNPRDALEIMDRNQIDLILIDYSMPTCNGQELAAVIRQHERYVSLPIIFISSYDDLQKALVDTGLGIDDFLVKPFMPDKLLPAVRSRAQRATELKSLMTRDGFTGLLNHVHFNEALAAELTRVRRGKHKASYAILDLDHFKSINDTYGHAAGDQVIKTIARMLQQHLRRSDIIGRCGGEEFGILLPECDVEKARGILEKILVAFSGTTFVFNTIKVNATFSAGLVQIHPKNDLDRLIRAADAALYQAKHEGRNRIILAENDGGKPGEL